MSATSTPTAGKATELKKRVITGVLGGAGLILLIIFGSWFGIFVLSSFLSLAMIYEYSRITFSLPDELEKRYVMLVVTWFAALANLLLPDCEFELLVLAFLSLFTYFLVSARRYEDRELGLHFRELVTSIFGLVYLVFLPFFLLRLHRQLAGVHWVLIFLFIVWMGDTGAYFAGRKFGRRKLYPLISPKKTIEGAVGGLVAGFAITLLYKLIVFRELSWAAVLFIPLIVGVAAQTGDLCESFLKRAFDKKDSGSLLPGHGGFLDRFDSVVFSLPVMYALTRIFA